MNGILKPLAIASLLGFALAACSTGTNSRSDYQGSSYQNSSRNPNWTDGKNGSAPGSSTTKGTTNGGD